MSFSIEPALANVPKGCKYQIIDFRREKKKQHTIDSWVDSKSPIRPGHLHYFIWFIVCTLCGCSLCVYLVRTETKVTNAKWQSTRKHATMQHSECCKRSWEAQYFTLLRYSWNNSHRVFDVGRFSKCIYFRL